MIVALIVILIVAIIVVYRKKSLGYNPNTMIKKDSETSQESTHKFQYKVNGYNPRKMVESDSEKLSSSKDRTPKSSPYSGDGIVKSNTKNQEDKEKDDSSDRKID